MLSKKKDRIEILRELPRKKSKQMNRFYKQPFIAVKSPQDAKKNFDMEMGFPDHSNQNNKMGASLRSLQPYFDLNRQLSYDLIKVNYNELSGALDYMLGNDH